MITQHCKKCEWSIKPCVSSAFPFVISFSRYIKSYFVTSTYGFTHMSFLIIIGYELPSMMYQSSNLYSTHPSLSKLQRLIWDSQNQYFDQQITPSFLYRSYLITLFQILEYLNKIDSFMLFEYTFIDNFDLKIESFFFSKEWEEKIKILNCVERLQFAITIMFFHKLCFLIYFFSFLNITSFQLTNLSLIFNPYSLSLIMELYKIFH